MVKGKNMPNIANKSDGQKQNLPGYCQKGLTAKSNTYPDIVNKYDCQKQ